MAYGGSGMADLGAMPDMGNMTPDLPGAVIMLQSTKPVCGSGGRSMTYDVGIHVLGLCE